MKLFPENLNFQIILFCFSVQIQFSLSLIYKLAESVDILDSHEKKNTNPWRDDGIFFFVNLPEKLDRFRKSSKIQKNHEFFLYVL